MSSPLVHFDHVLIQLSTSDFAAPPSWLADNFTILEGGTHAGGLTRNHLIPLPDGTYIELLNFLTPPASHDAWATAYPGDFALTTVPPVTAMENYLRLARALGGPEPEPEPEPELGPRSGSSVSHSSAEVDTEVRRRRAQAGDGGLGVIYKSPVPGGRRARSGEEVKWEIVGPEYVSREKAGSAQGPTDVPFFCHDVTERRMRVPPVPEQGHASGVVGVKAIEVLVERERVEAYVALYTAVLGIEEKAGEDGEREFRLGAPGVEGVNGVVRLRAARTEADERYLRERGVGVSALVFRVAGDGELRLPIAEYYLSSSSSSRGTI